MLKDIVAKRYAKALLQLASAEGNTDKVKSDIAAIAESYRTSRSLQSIVMNPVFSNADRARVVKGLMVGLKVSPITERFVDVLIEKRRFRYIREVAAAYSDLLDAMQGRVKATVTSAVPLSPAELDKIRTKVKSVVGKDVELTVDVDPSLIGGVRTRIGSTVYDGSLANQMKQMRETLLG